jgi:serine/threonine protein kinase
LLSELLLANQGDAASAPAGGGDRVGRFIVLECIGVGGMGLVFRAYDPSLDRKIALKLMRAEPGSNDGRDRVQREAMALARVSHPNVVTIFDVGEFDGQTYIAMELVEGGSLRAWLAERPRTQREILAAFRQAGEGLAAAHAVGLVHRDFKPENVLIGSDGRPRVTDFGLARISAGAGPPAAEEPSSVSSLDATITATGAMVGTPAYMAPEQHLGHTADERSDQFSFCVALYDALTGARPVVVGVDSPERVEVIIPDGSRHPSPRLRDPLLRGLECAATARYPSMEALLEALRVGSTEPAIAESPAPLSGPPGVSIALRGDGSAVGFYRNVFISVWYAPATLEKLALLRLAGC